MSAQLFPRHGDLTEQEMRRLKEGFAAGIELSVLRKRFRISREKIWEIVGKDEEASLRSKRALRASR